MQPKTHKWIAQVSKLTGTVSLPHSRSADSPIQLEVVGKIRKFLDDNKEEFGFRLNAVSRENPPVRVNFPLNNETNQKLKVFLDALQEEFKDARIHPKDWETRNAPNS